MPLTEVEKNKSFEWKISIKNMTHPMDNYRSENFHIDGYDVGIDCETDLSRSHLRFFYLRFRNDSSKLCPVFYTFSILDRVGHVFVTSEGKLLRDHINKQARYVMIIDMHYLESWDLIENGTITVRFSVESMQEGSNSTNGGKDTSLLETLSNDFTNLYENKKDADCILRVSESQFHVHRAVLSARSRIFSAMLDCVHDTANNHIPDIDIPDITAKVFGDVLYYVYSGKIRGLTNDTVMSMYTTAAKYELLELRTECLEFLKHNLILDNFCEVALIAHTLGEIELEERVVCFIEEKLDDVLESTSWQQFLKDKTLLANKLLTSALKLRLPLKRKFQDI